MPFGQLLAGQGRTLRLLELGGRPYLLAPTKRSQTEMTTQTDGQRTSLRRPLPLRHHILTPAGWIVHQPAFLFDKLPHPAYSNGSLQPYEVSG